MIARYHACTCSYCVVTYPLSWLLHCDFLSCVPCGEIPLHVPTSFFMQVDQYVGTPFRETSTHDHIKCFLLSIPYWCAIVRWQPALFLFLLVCKTPSDDLRAVPTYLPMPCREATTLCHVSTLNNRFVSTWILFAGALSSAPRRRRGSTAAVSFLTVFLCSRLLPMLMWLVRTVPPTVKRPKFRRGRQTSQ